MALLRQFRLRTHPAQQGGLARYGDAVDFARRVVLLRMHFAFKPPAPVQFHQRGVDLVIIPSPGQVWGIFKDFFDLVPGQRLQAD